MIKKVYFYRLTDAQGTQQITTVDDPANSGCIGGIDKFGKYQQYDSYELYHAYDWATQHGMKLQSGFMEIDIPDSIFQ